MVLITDMHYITLCVCVLCELHVPINHSLCSTCNTKREREREKGERKRERRKGKERDYHLSL